MCPSLAPIEEAGLAHAVAFAAAAQRNGIDISLKLVFAVHRGSRMFDGPKPCGADWLDGVYGDWYLAMGARTGAVGSVREFERSTPRDHVGVILSTANGYTYLSMVAASVESTRELSQISITSPGGAA